ncbi:phage terminase large subunit-like protein [Microbacterium foliorum]|uniref:Phage terminase large subunit-like protein n=1 Tax=Microbacterium foliorum TaxID=104336 RepID=A0ABU1HQR7_9MICO|nr:phage terminase large subunit-like protein [Microbacterium foliorum]
MASTTTRKRAAAPRARKRSAPRRVYGHEAPRVFTPPRRPLTPKTSAGYAAIHFAMWLHVQLAGTRYAELAPKLNPWQRWFLIHALELNPDGSYRFKTILLWVARQNGKTFIAALLILFRMFMDGDAQIIGVAQKLATAKKTWDHAQSIIDAIPRLKQEFGKANNINGELWFELTGGQRYWVDSADNGGRGLTFDLVFVDEILKHKTFKAWSALSKTTAARRRSQLIAASNTGDIEAIVQRFLHKQAIEAIEANDDSTTIGLFWWTPPPGMPLDTPEAWAYSNPSMNYNLPQENLAAYWVSDPRPVFESEVANIFVDSTTGGPFQQGLWNKGLDRLSKRADGADVYICIEVSSNRELAHIGFAAMREDGLIHVGIMQSLPGTDWIVPWLTAPERRFTPAGITFQTNGAPVSSLVGEFEAAELEVTPWGGPDLGRATGMLLDHVNLQKLRHRHQPLLEVAAQNAVVKKLADALVIDRSGSAHDASPLSAIAGALWLLKNPPKTPEPQIRTLKRRTRG